MKRSFCTLVCLAFLVAACGTEASHHVVKPKATQSGVTQPSDDLQPATSVIQATKIPEWCSNPPEDTVFRIYACGNAKSNNLAVAREMATLDAKGYLAGVISSVVNTVSSQKTASGSSLTATESETSKKSETLDIPIFAYSQTESETLNVGEVYHHFVLLELNIGAAANQFTDLLNNMLNTQRCPTGWKRVEGGCLNY